MTNACRRVSVSVVANISIRLQRSTLPKDTIRASFISLATTFYFMAEETKGR